MVTATVPAAVDRRRHHSRGPEVDTELHLALYAPDIEHTRAEGRLQFPLDSFLRLATSWVESSEGMQAERVASGTWCAVAGRGTRTHGASRVCAIWTLPGGAETGV